MELLLLVQYYSTWRRGAGQSELKTLSYSGYSGSITSMSISVYVEISVHVELALDRLQQGEEDFRKPFRCCVNSALLAQC